MANTIITIKNTAALLSLVFGTSSYNPFLPAFVPPPDELFVLLYPVPPEYRDDVELLSNEFEPLLDELELLLEELELLLESFTSAEYLLLVETVTVRSLE